MASVFSMIIAGELPGRFVWINPHAPGHTLVVPVDEVDHWLDAGDDLLAHLMHVSRVVGSAMMEAFEPLRIGMMIAGLEVAHLHLHLVPMRNVADLDFANADPSPDPADLDDAADRIRSALRAAGASGVVE
jgi:histidine triad (HIT) family protein